MDALVLRCARCGLVDFVPEDAYVAMGEPSLEDLGWHELGDTLVLECDDCHGAADAA